MLVGKRASVNNRAWETECQLHSLWFVLGAAVAVVAALPIGAIILVSVASLREESAHSLSGEAPGPGERAARRLLGFRTELPLLFASDDTEVRFVYARRPVSDPGKYSPSSQSQPYRISANQRERAGV